MGAFDDVMPITIPRSEEERKRWKWDAHEQVILKGSMDVSDQKYTANKMGRMGKDSQMEVLMGEGRYALLERMIISWTFTKNGHPMPLSSSSIGRLPSSYSTPILNVIDEINTGMTEEEQEDFLPSANGHIVESSTLTSLPLTIS
jgi:hypothetical protein